MLWMENLRLRVNSNAQSEVLRLIEIFKKEMSKSTNLLLWHIYRHAEISGDFSILLHWDTTEVNTEGSTLAYSLIKVLSPLGMVDHSIWIAQTGSSKE